MTAEEVYAEEIAEWEVERIYEALATERSPAKLDLLERELSDFRGITPPSRGKEQIKLPCRYCGSIDTEETRKYLWDLYYRLDDGGRKHIEPLVYTQSDFEDMGYRSMYDMDEESIDSVKLSMERNMAERGLCPQCGLPDLRGTTEEDYMTESEARDLADMYAEMAAERRAGC